jgi:hypothetical protein
MVRWQDDLDLCLTFPKLNAVDVYIKAHELSSNVKPSFHHLFHLLLL